MAADALLAAGYHILGFTSPETKVGTRIFDDLVVLGTDELLMYSEFQDVNVVIGIGFLPGSSTRRDVFQDMKTKNRNIETFIHPSALIGREVILGEGVQVMAGAIIQPRTKIADGVIINTGARIDHDTIIGGHSHIAPGVTICGGVTIGNSCFIGAGATIIQGVQIGDNAVIAAGVIVCEDVLSKQVYTGRKRSA